MSDHHALEQSLEAIEDSLGGLRQAMLVQDAGAVRAGASELQRALARAVETFMQAGRTGGVPPALRHRLAVARARVSAQRQSLARATAALDRAIDILVPQARSQPALYAPHGAADRRGRGGLLQA